METPAMRNTIISKKDIKITGRRYASFIIQSTDSGPIWMTAEKLERKRKDVFCEMEQMRVDKDASRNGDNSNEKGRRRKKLQRIMGYLLKLKSR